MCNYPDVYFCQKGFFKISLKLMENLSQVLQKHSPKLRDQKKDETTPEYLNYINQMVNETHEDILQFSPFHKIAEIFKTTEPLSLKEIKEIFDEVKRCNSLQSNKI
jgi:hypothetical protein